MSVPGMVGVGAGDGTGEDAVGIGDLDERALRGEFGCPFDSPLATAHNPSPARAIAIRKKPCRKGDGPSEDFTDEPVLVN